MKIGFIGCGNMGGALLQAVVQVTDPSLIYICDTDENKTQHFEATFGVMAVDLEYLCENAEMIFLGIKPVGIPALLETIKPYLANNDNDLVIISMAAGVTIQSITNIIGDIPVIRIMPNLPVAVGAGTILYTAEGNAKAYEDDFKYYLTAAGCLCAIPESQMNAGCALSGCGPAYGFMFIEAMADAGVSAGLSRVTAQTLAAQTLLGAAQMVLATGQHPGELKDAVCSPGGTTIKGVLSLEQNGFRSAVAQAVICNA